MLYRHPDILEAAGCRSSGRQMGRNAMRVRHPEGRCERHGRGYHRVLPQSDGALQGAEARRFRTAAEDVDGEDSNISFASAPATSTACCSRRAVMGDAQTRRLDLRELAHNHDDICSTPSGHAVCAWDLCGLEEIARLPGLEEATPTWLRPCFRKPPGFRARSWRRSIKKETVRARD